MTKDKFDFFDDEKLGNYKLKDIGFVTAEVEDSSEWCLVEARVKDRGSPMYKEGVYRVIDTFEGEGILEEDKSIEFLDEKEIKSRMPRRAKRRMSVPSIRGQYAVVVEIKKRDGEIETIGRSSVIPIEYVIQPLSYSEALEQMKE